MKILCANPKIEFEAYKSEILESIDSVYNSGIYIGGEQTENLEYEFDLKKNYIFYILIKFLF